MEATMIIMDNSEYSRNGDYGPTRFDAQKEATYAIFQAKKNANAESAVGLMSMGGDKPDVLVTLTTEQGQIDEGLRRTKIKGFPHFTTSINIARLALKHREKKSQKQRIIVFTCSLVEEHAAALKKLGDKLKKENVAVDIVRFGQPDEVTEGKLTEFHNRVSSAGGASSTYQYFAPSTRSLRDLVVGSPILGGGQQQQGAGADGVGEDGFGGQDASDFLGGVNPELEPELALALRMSYEEEMQRQKNASKAQEEARKREESKLPNITEDDEQQPLLTDDKSKAEEAKDGDDGSKKDHHPDGDKKDDGDKMDTA